MNTTVIVVSIPFLLAGFTEMSEWVRTRLPWFPLASFFGGILGILSGVYWNSWDSPWFTVLVICALLIFMLSLLRVIRKVTITSIEDIKTYNMIDLVKVRFSHPIWNGISNSEPYIDFIFEVINASGSPITIIGASGWIEIDGTRCNIPPQTSRQYISHGDTRNIRIHQSITTGTSESIRGRQAEFRFSMCGLLLESDGEVRLEGVHNLNIELI